MAYVRDDYTGRPEDEEEAPIVGGSAGTTVAGDKPAAPKSAAEAGSGTFANIDDYMKVNQGNLGEKLAGQLSQELDTAARTRTASENAFRGEVDKGKVGFDQGLSDRVLADPAKASQSDFSAYQSQLGADYSGPTSYAPDDGLDKAAKHADLAQTEEGKFSLLQDYFKRPDYTRGQQTLDQALLQRDPGSQAAFGAAKTKSDQNKAMALENLKSLQGYANQADVDTENTRNQARGALQRTNDAFTGQLSDRYNSALNDYNTNYLPAYQSAANHPEGSTYAQQAAPTQASVMTPEDKARYLALSKLSGVDPTLVTAESEVGGDLYSANAPRPNEYATPVVAPSDANQVDSVPRGVDAGLGDFGGYDPYAPVAPGPGPTGEEIDNMNYPVAYENAVLTGVTQHSGVAEQLGWVWNPDEQIYQPAGSDTGGTE